jgi:large subunit ribosomal protein L24
MSKETIKKGDMVAVIAGKEKHKTGEVLEVLHAKVDKTHAGLPRPRTSSGLRYIIHGVNLITKHVKKEGREEGGIIRTEAPLPASKVILAKNYKGRKEDPIPKDKDTDEVVQETYTPETTDDADAAADEKPVKKTRKSTKKSKE